MLIISSLICGAMAVLLWGILGFPQKLGISRIFKENSCLEELTICPEGWIRINNTCFFKYEKEATWKLAQDSCRASHASLAKVISQEEMESLMQNLGSSSYWFGLHKHSEHKFWMWADGSMYTNWFNIEEHGDCTFISKKGISSANCDEIKDYICSRKSYCP
ncbi:C-type lectin domain family 2 member F-like isoform X2 [Tupaia chinensis]|nr:C-type lectin domain family 2 member F-like isoform X2 [Tupaia chinensis]